MGKNQTLLPHHHNVPTKFFRQERAKKKASANLLFREHPNKGLFQTRPSCFSPYIVSIKIGF